MAQSFDKPFQFRLGSLFRSVAKTSVGVAMLSRLGGAEILPIQVLYPLAAATGVAMLLFGARYYSAR